MPLPKTSKAENEKIRIKYNTDTLAETDTPYSNRINWINNIDKK